MLFETANPEARSMRYDPTQKIRFFLSPWSTEDLRKCRRPSKRWGRGQWRGQRDHRNAGEENNEEDNVASKDQKAISLKKDLVFQSEWQSKYPRLTYDADRKFRTCKICLEANKSNAFTIPIWTFLDEMTEKSRRIFSTLVMERK